MSHERSKERIDMDIFIRIRFFRCSWLRCVNVPPLDAGESIYQNSSEEDFKIRLKSPERKQLLFILFDVDGVCNFVAENYDDEENNLRIA